ncbi:aminoglycoside phosphotransferase family protein [Amycolatopsis jejuensis]|uniref:aminoglycoside phosphotransferase family protein n=1 Tax=Amycolatopsis jejuensis TaxID=330084 RepID=UPI001FDFC774|nr:aminoglycoside phosphotransferase family protein [Amycolatopsis jejuensis]
MRYEQDLVRALLHEQHPDLAALELRDVEGGWDNQQWRLGPDLAVRLPRSDRAPGLLRTEQAWLPVLAERLPLPVPTPVRVGEPSPRFAHPWTIAHWVAGEPADRAPITRPDAADTLAGFLRALHHPAPFDAPASSTRGVPLAQLDPEFPSWLEAISTNADAAREVWDEAVAAPAWTGSPLWLHGDLHPANVVTQDGALTGVIDFGDLSSGDPATDLSAAWILLPADAAPRFFAAYAQADEATITRARGWAVMRALNLIWIGQRGRNGLPGGKPTWEPAGYATLERVLAG